MSRAAITDLLQDHCFWLMDVTSLSFPLFLPISGFSKVTAPGISVELTTINDGTSPFTKKAIKTATADTVQLAKGVTFYDSDFYAWIMAGITGNPSYWLGPGNLTPRRNLLLIHFFAHNPTGVPIPHNTGIGNSLFGFDLGILGSNTALRIPARAFLLKNCLPVTYKSGNDYDAASGAVSINTLDIDVESFEQISLSV